MELGNGMALLGLLGLIIPIVIFFLSRKSQKVIKFGSIQFLSETSSPSAKSFFPSEWIPLLLRSLLVALACLFLSKPLFKEKQSQPTILIEKSVYEDPNFKSILNELKTEPEVFETSSLNLLIKKVNQIPSPVKVYTRNLYKHYHGEAAALDEKVEWIIVPFYDNLTMSDTAMVGDQVFVSDIISNEVGLRWKTENVDGPIEIDTIGIQFITAEKKEEERVFLRGILKAYETVLPLNFDEKEKKADWKIAIDTIVPDANISWTNFQGPLQLETISTKNHQIRGTPENTDLTASPFSLEFAHIFLHRKFNLEQLDRRVAGLPPTFASETAKEDDIKVERRTYWIILMLLILLTERWYSRKLALS